MSRWLDRIQIRRSGSLGISDDLNNFWEESIEKKWPTKRLVGAISYEQLVGSHSNLTW